MYISELKIENYRNFEDFEIPLNPFTLIIGENNSGKSNLLDALGLIFSQEITFFKKRILETDDINFQAVEEFKKEVADKGKELDAIEFPKVKVEVLLEDLNEDQEAVAGDWFIDTELKKAKLTYIFRLREGWTNKTDWLKKQRENFSDDSNYRVEFPIKQYEYLIYGGGEASSKADPYFLRMFKMELLDALRDTRRELTASSEYKLLHKILINRDEAKFSDVKKIIQELQNKLHNHSELDEVEEDIKAYLKKISLQEDEENNSVKFNFSSPETNEILKKLSLSYGNEPVGIERNGLGRNNLLYISLVLSHLAGESVGANFTYFRLVGIEEPESHLHPHLQDHLARNIRSETRNDMQLILTSHSANVAAKLDLENTFILFKNNEQTTCHHQILKGMDQGSNSVRYLKKFLDATNSTMFFAKKIILVEGICEQLLIPVLFELHTGKSLDKLGCNIVNVAGVSFRHFLEIIKNGYFIKCLALTDSDSDLKKPEESRASKLKRDYSSCDTIRIEESSKTTFEKDIIESNKSDKNKRPLLKALETTRPRKGKELCMKFNKSKTDIDVNEYFDAIVNYKSEFSSNLIEVLKEDNKCFVIPDYIKSGFDFITNNNE